MPVSFHMQHLKRVEALSFKPSLGWVVLSLARMTSSSEKGKVKVCTGMKVSHLVMFCLMIRPQKQIKSVLIRDANIQSPLFFREQRITSFKQLSGQERVVKVRTQGLRRTPH